MSWPLLSNLFQILPLPCSHPNVNGCMARPGLFFQRQPWIVELLRVLPNTSYPKKTFSRCWVQTQAIKIVSTASDRFIHGMLSNSDKPLMHLLKNGITYHKWFQVWLKYPCYTWDQFCHSRIGGALMPVSFIVTVPAGILFGNFGCTIKLAKHPFLSEEN